MGGPSLHPTAQPAFVTPRPCARVAYHPHSQAGSRPGRCTQVMKQTSKKCAPMYQSKYKHARLEYSKMIPINDLLQ